MFYLLILLLGVGLWYVVRKLRELEAEIRRDIEEKNRSSEEEDAGGEKVTPADNDQPNQQRDLTPKPDRTLAEKTEEGPTAIDLRVLALVAEFPGLLQTELYGRLPDLNRRELQQLLLKLDREGRIRREKQGGSYRVFPL